MAEFQEIVKEFEASGIYVVAGSADSREMTMEFVKARGITLHIAYGLNAEEISRITGAFYSKKRMFIQPTEFIIKPDRTMDVAVYSTGPIGRFDAKKTLKYIRYYQNIGKGE
ncbi:peroxiredoxin family protein [bacterium]|nr:peroxiredoxin family protein [bacterium]